MALLSFIRRLFDRFLDLFRRGRRERVVFTEEGVLLVWPQRGEEGVSWDAIHEIALRVTPGSVTADRLHLYLMARPHRLVVSQSAENFDKLMTFVRGLPGCRGEAFDTALREEREGLYPVWRRPERLP